METFNVHYKIKKKGNEKYIILADFHGAFNLDLANYINKITAKYIIIAGDLLNGYAWTNQKKLNKLKAFLNIIKKNHIVIVCLGNHDLWHLTEEGFNNFRALEDTNIKTLFNETKIIGNDAFTNFLPDVYCYAYFKQDEKETVANILKTYKTRIKPVKGNYIRHLISHNPYHFWHEEIMHEIINDYDIIEVGHFHDGWIPTKYLSKHYDACLDKGIQEIIKNRLLFTNQMSLSVKPKRNLSRGIVYMYVDGYFILLPNNKIYYYNRAINEYHECNKEDLIKKMDVVRTPALIITGAINTFMNLKMFYPYVTTLELSDDYLAKYTINKIK